MRKLLFTFLFLSAAFYIMAAEEDWRMTMFDRAQEIMLDHDQKAAALIKELEPRLADWCAGMAATEEAKRKAERYGFSTMLRKNMAIAWDEFGLWVHSFNVRSAEAGELARADPVFDNLCKDYWAASKAIPDDRKAREMIETIREKLLPRGLEIDNERSSKLKALYGEIQKKANQAPEPSPKRP
jgi:hypothetical protein